VKVLGIVLSLMMVGAQAAPTCDPTMSSMRFSPSWWQRTDAGWYAFVACRNPDTGLFDFYGAACRHGVCNQTDWWNAMADYGTAIGDTAKKASFGTSWLKIMTNDCSAPSSLDEAICTAYTTARDAAKAKMNVAITVPPPITYTKHVKPNPQATDGSRPAYSWDPVVKKIGAVVGRAQKDQACKDYVVVSGTAGDGYAEFAPDFKANVIALCTPN
jgi:hypothetical protein